jgi:hypothetical protein
VNGQTTKYLVDTNYLTGYAQVVEELSVHINTASVFVVYVYGLDLIARTSRSSAHGRRASTATMATLSALPD